MSDINIIKPYKIRARGIYEWKRFEAVRMEISVGQEYHEGLKIEAAMDWAKNNFKRIILLIGDAPQRHNMIFDHDFSEEEAFKNSISEGDKWLERNKHLFSKDTEIARWQHFLDDSRYMDTLRQCWALYRGDKKFKTVVQDNIKDTWRRKIAREPEIAAREEEFFQISEKYLLEETAVFALAYKDYPYVSAYPGSYNKMWAMFVDKHFEGMPEGLSHAHCIRLCINRRKGYKNHEKPSGEHS